MYVDDGMVEGNLDVLRNLFVARSFKERDDPRFEHYVFGFAGQGGAMRGTYGAGQLAAFERHRLMSLFKFGVAASTFSPTLAFSLTGNVVFNRSVYWKECASRKFLLLVRPFLPNPELRGPMMDIDYLCDVFRGNNERGIRLDIEALRQSPTALYVAVTKSDGSPVLIDIRTAADPIEVIKASIAMPGISRGHVDLGDDVYFDGSGAVPFSATEAVRFEPTDLVIVANCPKPKDGACSEIPAQLLSTLPEGARTAFENLHRGFTDGLAWLRKQRDFRWLILWSPPSGVWLLERNASRIEAASLRAEDHLHGLLEQCREPVFA
jgi:predicted patatin/cPLA2 family phospholipase